MAHNIKSLGLASRFAVLNVEDDFSSDSDGPGDSKVKSTSIKKNQPVKANATQEKPKSKKKKNKGQKNGDADLLSLAFASSKSKNKNSNQKTNSGANNSSVSNSQWEQWKEKDTNFVAETYESDLSQALLLSKIDYEEKKKVYEYLQKEAEESKLVVDKKIKKKKEKSVNTMSLEKFHNLLPSQLEAIRAGNDNEAAGDCEANETEVKRSPSIVEDNFFDSIKENAAKIIREESSNDTSKKKRYSPEYCRSLQYEDELEKKQDQIEELKKENEDLKEELKKVKRRNKQLCHILGQGEMSEKAEILLQMDEITKVKNELTEQVTEQHTALEQEKSKVHSLQVELRKYQGKKEHRESK